MNYLLTISTVAVWALAGSIHGADPAVHLFILSGQSNMARMKPEVSFTPTIEKKFGKDNFIIVKDAKSGGPIRFWYKKAPEEKKGNKPGWLYDRLMGKVKETIKGKTIKTITIVWMQGESDSKRNGKEYPVQLREVLNQFRQDLNVKDLNVVIGRISDHGMDKAHQKGNPHWELVRQALVDVAESEPFGAWVNTDDLNDWGTKVNDLHYSSEGYKKLGFRFAEKAIELIEKRAK